MLPVPAACLYPACQEECYLIWHFGGFGGGLDKPLAGECSTYPILPCQLGTVCEPMGERV